MYVNSINYSGVQNFSNCIIIYFIWYNWTVFLLRICEVCTVFLLRICEVLKSMPFLYSPFDFILYKTEIIPVKYISLYSGVTSICQLELCSHKLNLTVASPLSKVITANKLS